MNSDERGAASLETVLLHLDRRRDADGAVHAPVHPSVPYGHPDTEALIAVFQQSRPGFTYARQTNPTNAALEAKVSLLEGARDSVVFATGMGAISATFFSLLAQGSHVVCSRHVFGNTSSLLRSFERFGVAVDFVDATSAGTVEAALRPATRLVFVETIANPGTEVADLEGIGALCRERGVLFVVDNSLTTPALVQPGRFGAGLVVNSLTKGFGGHGAAMGGAISDTGCHDWAHDPGVDPLYRTGDPAKFGLTQIRRKGVRDCGASLRAEDAHRLAVGAETLHLRVERASANALALARWLERRPEVASVRYPGLESHPQHERARRLFGNRFGQLLSFSFRPDHAFAPRLDRLRQVVLATHLWDARTLAIPVAHTIFAELGEVGRKAAGIDDGLIRLSIGLENPEDLIADFAQAFDAAAEALA
ncbi:O-acetylhomoserine (thiol)-lyase [Enhydrobacter aerosaccus]|uniref:O-acetylhomoserine (Thiol)-lyase n=1 Tax=Enhydrobacter aerosaccus TaxID=225324 RepID=A0A1T4SS64_9HYPH|nr:aminotransferase class I/II-fold pyridoxal phosphate-dependent enzyme [Enhydrobacter aerosaccus]SKA30972.1 O-acetylhomoserine (thiol)-lyase [Enhydrobacter aerosaccus]